MLREHVEMLEGRRVNDSDGDGDGKGRDDDGVDGEKIGIEVKC